jgi:hypothetical protein
MAQQPTRYCQQCGTPMGPEQRFCSNCGATMDGGEGRATELAQDRGAAQEETRAATPPPPPQAYGQGGMSYNPPPPMQQGYQAGGAYTPPMGSMGPAQPQVPRRSAWGTTGCVLIGVILVVVLVCGGGAYLGYQFLRSAANSASNTTESGSVSDGTNSSTATAAAVVKTTTFPTNPPQSVDYADVIITVLDAKQSTSFADDSGDGNGILRLDMRLQNTYKSGALIGDAFNVVLPDGTVVGKSDSQDGLYPSGNTTVSTWVDFPVPTSTDVSKVVLRVGAPGEEQMNVPLTGHADLSQYQAKSASPNAKTPYAGMNWTVTTVKAQESYQGAQAKQGNMYVYVSFAISNNSSKDFDGYYGDYLRLRSGATTSPPQSADNFPTLISAGQTNVQATCAFIMPKGSTDFTLIFEADPGGSYPQETVTFQIK